jgi:succinylarginine dihydrolase
MTIEANFDGLVGPSHHYGGLGVGNLASLGSQNTPSHPRGAALQGLEKMRAVANLGVPQFFLPPCQRPNIQWLRHLGFGGSDADVLKSVADADVRLLSAAWSSAFMWTANAATVTPSMDSRDGQLHVSVANLTSNLHRQQESGERYDQLVQILSKVPNAVVHRPLPSSYPLRDEGAANHMRLSGEAGQGVHVLVDGDAVSSGFLGRQGRLCSTAIARRHSLKEDQVFFLQQHPDAVAAGVFHNDVIATSHQHLMIHHEKAFFDADSVLEKLDQVCRRKFGRDLLRVVVKENELTLKDAVASYLFNSQIVTNGAGTFTILCPENCQRVWAAETLLQRWMADDRNPISDVIYLPLDQSMANGGGPACLRLRIQLTAEQLAAIPKRYAINDANADEIAGWIERWYPETLNIADLADIKFAKHCWAAIDDLSK